MENVLKMIPKNILANELREGIEDWKVKGKSFALSTLHLAEKFYKARCEFKADIDFGIWLVENELTYFGDDTRAAFINLGKNIEVTRERLEITETRSVRLFWKNEVEPEVDRRYRNAAKPTPSETETQNPQESPSQSEEKSDEGVKEEQKSERQAEPESNPESKEKKPSQWKLSKLPQAELVAEYVLDSRQRSYIGKIVNRRKSPIWDLLVEAISIGVFGPPQNKEYSSSHTVTLRLVLPWCPISYAKKYDLAKSADRLQVRNNIFPVALKHREELFSDPDKLPFLIQESFQARQMEREEKRRQESIAQMPKGQQRIIAFGETIWPRINDDPFTYEELCLALWFFNFIVNQFPVNWDHKSKALQIQQMLKWLIPVCKFANWPTAVRKLCAAYSANPEANCEFPPPPINFGIG